VTRNSRQSADKSYRSLLMWGKADELVKSVYCYSKDFPKYELYGLTSQLRRAALSVVLNIVEGYGRSTKGELKRFLDIAFGSLVEVEYLLRLSLDLGYLSQNSYRILEQTRTECSKLIWSYRKKLV
jgi:four helix bundle protein